jgi:predicted MFS family arabinose efflux permease
VGLISVALFLLIYPLVEGRETGWPMWAVVCLAAAVPVLAAFVLYEERLRRLGGSPLVQLGLFRDRAFTFGLLTSLTFCGGLSAFFLTVTLFLQRGLEYSPTRASLTFAPFSVGYLAASVAGVRLARRFGSRVIVVGAGLMAAALAVFVILARLRGLGLSQAELMAVLLGYGVGQGLAMPALIGAALSRVPAAEAGSAAGVLTTAQQVAFSLGVAGIGSVFFAVLGDAPSPGQHAVAVGASLLCNVGLLLLTCLLAFALPRSMAGGHVAEL